MKKIAAMAIVLVLAVFWLRQDPPPLATGQLSPAHAGASRDDAAAEAFARRESGRMLATNGVVDRILSDDRDGSRHQRFILRTDQRPDPADRTQHRPGAASRRAAHRRAPAHRSRRVRVERAGRTDPLDASRSRRIASGRLHRAAGETLSMKPHGKLHSEFHRVDRIGWLRAAVLGANDGLISTASLVVGVSAAQLPTSAVLLTGLAGLVGGALSMAAGEYVSVSSQADSERADLAREREELATTPEAEHRELIGIYVRRGLSRDAGRAGRDADDGARRARRARARRTGHHRADARAAAAGRGRLGAVVRARRAAAAAGDLPRGAGPAFHLRCSPAALVLLVALGALGARLGGAPVLRAGAARRLLGRRRDGCHGADRPAVSASSRASA